MGIFSWLRGNKDSDSMSDPKTMPATQQQPPSSSASEVPGMNGAMKVPRRPESVSDITVFEFGSVAASADKVTLAGFCPVSDELEPCRWEVLPASGPDAPQFRVVF